MNWLQRNLSNVAIGIISGLLATGIWTAILQIPTLYDFVFKKKRPACSAELVDSHNLYVYSWEIALPIPENFTFMIYANTEMYIEKLGLDLPQEMQLTRYIGEEASGAHYGFVAKIDPNLGRRTISFKIRTRSQERLRSNVCSHFLFVN